MSKSLTTTDHETIKKWAEERGGKPAIVEGTENNEEGAGVLRIKFTDGSGESLKETDWSTFFNTFDKRNLAFLYQDEISNGEESRFFKLVNR